MTATPNRDPASVPVSLINTKEGLDELSGVLRRSVRTAVDTETHKALIVDGIWAALRVISYAVKLPCADGFEYQAYVVDFRDVPAEALAPVHDLIEVADAWNANFDARVTKIGAVPVKRWRDAMLTDALLHAGVPGFDFYHSLASATKRYTGFEMSGKGTTQISFDGETDLTHEQVRYAGHDAYLTLLVAERLDELAVEAGIQDAVTLDQGGRPFIAAMMEYGFPFDAEGWKGYLQGHSEKKILALHKIRDLTGGGKVEETLFGTEVDDNPTWNVESGPERKAALNRWAKDLVHAFTGGSDLGNNNQLDKTALRQMVQLAEAGTDPKLTQQAELCQALLTYDPHAKILSTYGDSILKFVQEDGRMRPRYKQALTATGRLSSDKPNAQNLAPDMKQFIRPAKPSDGEMYRVFVHNDLSQAELRVLAQLADEKRMLEMFETGKDFHTLTAADMLKIDMEALEQDHPALFAKERKKAKGVNFGIPYGLGAAALAVSLTVNSGVKTTTDEASTLLKTYASTYTKVDAWLSERDGFVRALAESYGKGTAQAPDWASTFKLHELWLMADQRRKALKREHGSLPTGVDLAEAVQPEHMLRSKLEDILGRVPTDEEAAQERQLQGDALDWAFSFDSPVVLSHDGSPLAFESRTVTGRRKVYMVQVDSDGKNKFAGLLTSAMLLLATTNKPEAARIRDDFAIANNLDLPRGVDRCKKAPGEDTNSFRSRSNEHRKSERTRCVKAFEGSNKRLKAAFVREFIEKMGERAGEMLLGQALSDQIRQMGNQYRNMPIQGTVADIVLLAFEDIYTRLQKYQDAWPVQSVHDSIVIECRLDEAQAVAMDVKEALEAAMRSLCPDVVAKADADVRLSLDDKDVLSDEAISTMLEQYAS